MKKTIITTSWDDGHPLDLKLAKLLKKYDIPATFYIPIKNEERETLDEEGIKEISKDFDVGGHTYSHRYLTNLSREEAYNEIKRGKETLEKICDCEIDSFCYPSGKYNKRIIELVKKSGFEGARTIHQLNLSQTPRYETGTTLHVTGPGLGHLKNFKNWSNSKNLNLLLHLTRRNVFSMNWFDLAKYVLNFVKSHGGIFHLWGHSWEIKKHEQWEKLEQIFRIISKENKLEHMSNTEILNMVKEK